MTQPTILQWQPLALCTLLCGFPIACTKQVDRPPLNDEPPINHSKNNARQNDQGEPRMAKSPKFGFRDYVKNPDLFRAETADAENAGAAPPPTAPEVAQLVAALGRRKLEYAELLQLRKAGDKAAPLLQAALRDEKVLFHRYGNEVFAGSAMDTALDLLEPFGLPEVGLLKPALRHPDEYFRQHALYHLARCGNDDAIEPLIAGLNSKSEDCRSWTLMGLAFLKNSARGSKKFRTALFEATLPLLADKEFNPAQKAPVALLALDPDCAKTALIDTKVLNPENESVHYVLQALKDARVAVSGPKLRSLLAEIKKKAKEYPFDYAYAEGLILLARVESSGASDVIADAHSWGNDRVKEGAAQASAVAAGVDDASAFVSELYQRKGVEGLTKPQLYYFTLTWLDGEVRNGGFSQYYFNTSGELAAHAVQAAKAVGASELSGIIQKANSLFGANGPSPDRKKRMDQLSKIDSKALDALDTRYYACSEKLDELLPKYVAANAKDFKSSK